MRRGKSFLIIDLSQVQIEIQDGDTKRVTVTAVGGYNHFAARGHVQANKIAKANIFHPMWKIYIQAHDDSVSDGTRAQIKNGNMFQSLCRIGATPTVRFLAPQEKVYFLNFFLMPLFQLHLLAFLNYCSRVNSRTSSD